jgi:transaldolase
MALDDLRVKIFADGAEISTIAKMCRNPVIRGFTTNPTLMRKAGVSDYRAFALAALAVVGERPISFEVFSDEFAEMEAQAREIASWGRQVYVKVPVTNTRGDFSGPLIGRLTGAGVKVNVTALTTADQVAQVERYLAVDTPSVVSVFAGRIADTGRDPAPIMADALKLLLRKPHAELLWASPRELLNIVQADAVGCHVITVTDDLLNKAGLIGKDLLDFSLETVQMFREDALKAGFTIDIGPMPS